MQWGRLVRYGRLIIDELTTKSKMHQRSIQNRRPFATCRRLNSRRKQARMMMVTAAAATSASAELVFSEASLSPDCKIMEKMIRIVTSNSTRDIMINCTMIPSSHFSNSSFQYVMRWSGFSSSSRSSKSIPPCRRSSEIRDGATLPCRLESKNEVPC